MMTEKKVNLYIVIWIIILFLLFSLNQFRTNYQLKKQLSEIRVNLKNVYEQRIKNREVLIKKLRSENELNIKEIQKRNKTIDSLNTIKQKIQIKYIRILKDIKVMDADKLKKYWNEEFN